MESTGVIVGSTGAIVGRFQVPYLHEGHLHLLNTVNKISERLVVIIGNIEEVSDLKNPYSYAYRKGLILKTFPKAAVYGIFDYPLNEQWSLALDGILSIYHRPILYGSRDCFMKNYIGELPCVRIPEIPGVSGTKLREQLKNQ
jgi:bifunctional NMN adenylyltransferase/nudix hydrolase